MTRNGLWPGSGLFAAPRSDHRRSLPHWAIDTSAVGTLRKRTAMLAYDCFGCEDGPPGDVLSSSAHNPHRNSHSR